MAEELGSPEGAEAVETWVKWPTDVLRAAEAARRFAALLGFPAVQCEEIGLVVTELASNLLRHAAGGKIRLLQINRGERTGGERTGIEVQSLDKGPGIADVEKALTDGYSTAGGLGLGLGTVNRMMTDLEFRPEIRGGVQIVCRRWLLKALRGAKLEGLAFGAATRSFGQLPDNGDSFVIKQWDGNALVGVIDGLGHGPYAQVASRTARHYVEQHFSEPLVNVFKGADRACRATRGVVMALARINLAEDTLTVASVGNVEMRLSGGGVKFNPVIRRGIVGLNAPGAVSTEHCWSTAKLLVMHSDGLRTKWEWSQYTAEIQKAPNVLAQRLLADMGRTDDDATVVVVKGTH